MEQEHLAGYEHYSHEPALPLVRMMLRERKPLPRILPVSRPLTKMPFFNHVGEKVA